jgi:hypothetical protein
MAGAQHEYKEHSSSAGARVEAHDAAPLVLNWIRLDIRLDSNQIRLHTHTAHIHNTHTLPAYTRTHYKHNSEEKEAQQGRKRGNLIQKKNQKV